MPLADMDRALLDGEAEGFARVHLKKGTDKILGATVVARHAGEMINELSLARTAGMGLSAIGKTIHPYPTQADKETGRCVQSDAPHAVCKEALYGMAKMAS